MSATKDTLVPGGAPDAPRELRARKAAFALAAGFVLLASIETAQALLAPARVTPASDWDAAAAEVRAEFKDGDLIVFAPDWADQVGRAHLGDKISVEMAGRDDADHYARVWEVAIRGAHAPETAGLKPIRETRHGRVKVSLYEKPSIGLVYDFTAHFEDAIVLTTSATGADEKPCYKDNNKDTLGYRCIGGRVERRTLEVDYHPRRGLLAPVQAGRILAIEYRDIQLGKELVGYTGLADFNSRKNGSGAVDYRVLIDGKEVYRFKHHNEDNWHRFSIATDGARHSLRFEISAPDSSWRTFGFHAEARP